MSNLFIRINKEIDFLQVSAISDKFKKVSLKTFIGEYPSIFNTNMTTISDILDGIYDISTGTIKIPLTTTGTITANKADVSTLRISNKTGTAMRVDGSILCNGTIKANVIDCSQFTISDTDHLYVNMDGSLESISSILDDASTAAYDASVALSDASTAAYDASIALSAANTALTTANTAVTNANTAVTNANTAVAEANTAADNANTAATAAAQAKELLFRDLWNSACNFYQKKIGQYNTTTGYYEVNGITDLTYQQALMIYDSRVSNMQSSYAYIMILKRNLRTCIMNGSTVAASYEQAFNYMVNVEKLDLINTILPTTLSCAFRGNPILTTISSVIDCSNNPSLDNIFKLDPKLTTVYIAKLKTSISFSDSPLLSAASVNYLITNKYDSTTAITIALHATAYANLTAGSGDWAGLMAAGTAKGITWASA